MKNGALLNCLTESVIDEQALYEELKDGGLRAFLDWTPKQKGYNQLPLDVFYCSNESSAFNTHSNIKITSDWTTDSIINMLTKYDDKYLVNPDYKK